MSEDNTQSLPPVTSMTEEEVLSTAADQGEESKTVSPKMSRRFSGVHGVRRASTIAAGPIVQSLRRATSWILGRRDSSVPVDVPSKRISDGSLPPVVGDLLTSLEPRRLMSVRCGGASLRGYRHKFNEDSLCIEANLVDGVLETGTESTGFAAVFDGHAGSGCSSHLQTALSSCVRSLLLQEPGMVNNTYHPEEWRRSAKKLLLDSFTVVDDEFLRFARMRGDPSGACAAACLVKGSSVIIAHVGDCAVVLIDKNHETPGLRLTRDHDARNSAEVKRVMGAGGTIMNDRLGGRLQPFRAFGDVEFKGPGGCLTVFPDIIEQEMTPSSCLLLCSDGVTSYMSDQEIAEFVMDEFEQGDDDPARVASALVTHISKAKHGLDDASVVLLVFDEVAS